MNNIDAEMLEEMMQQIDMGVTLTQTMFKSLSERPNFWENVAKCYAASVSAFEAEGFSRAEAISLAGASVGSFNKK